MNNKTKNIEFKFASMCNERFGTDIFSRIRKLEEETNELFEVSYELMQGDTPGAYEHFKDEISDVQAVLTHLASIVGLNFQTCLEMAKDKIEKRDTEPNYKRYGKDVQITKNYSLEENEEITIETISWLHHCFAELFQKVPNEIKVHPKHKPLIINTANMITGPVAPKEKGMEVFGMKLKFSEDMPINKIALSCDRY